MKTIIISDIEGKSESIIPYGLHIRKHTRSEADILHIIDPRKQQGTGSSYADSKSITTVFDWLALLDPLINALGITKMKHFVDMEMKSAVWKQVVEEHMSSSKDIKTADYGPEQALSVVLN